MFSSKLWENLKVLSAVGGKLETYQSQQQRATVNLKNVTMVLGFTIGFFSSKLA